LPLLESSYSSKGRSPRRAIIDGVFALCNSGNMAYRLAIVEIPCLTDSIISGGAPENPYQSSGAFFRRATFQKHCHHNPQRVPSGPARSSRQSDRRRFLVAATGTPVFRRPACDFQAAACSGRLLEFSRSLIDTAKEPGLQYAVLVYTIRDCRYHGRIRRLPSPCSAGRDDDAASKRPRRARRRSGAVIVGTIAGNVMTRRKPL